jgi:hypothetical protein
LAPGESCDWLDPELEPVACELKALVDPQLEPVRQLLLPDSGA